MTPIDALVAKAAELVDSIEFDVNGMALPTAFVGGHGGLTSDKTLRLKDELRVLINCHETQQKENDQ